MLITTSKENHPVASTYDHPLIRETMKEYAVNQGFKIEEFITQHLHLLASGYGKIITADKIIEFNIESINLASLDEVVAHLEQTKRGLKSQHQININSFRITPEIVQDFTLSALFSLILINPSRVLELFEIDCEEYLRSLINKDYEGTTALYMAASKGYADVIELLLDNDADPNQPITGDGATALFIAAFEGYADVDKRELGPKGPSF